MKIKADHSLSQMEEIMEKSQAKVLPRWIFTLLAIGGAWASGVYLGKITIEGASTEFLIPVVAFGLMALLMTWGALAER
jgi:hypothetical protein